ncbi:MAG: TonB family protein [Bacteroidetes bacterium]|nr:TonB family protein [Bacteroidota bacterium]
MKTQANHCESFDEIVFTDRNKEYGAYEIRRNYAGSLNKAMGISITILLLVLSVPLIANYLGKSRMMSARTLISVDIGGLVEPPVTPPPPPPPPVNENPLDKKLQFIAPVITSDTAAADDTYGNQEILNMGTGRKTLDTIDFTGGGKELPRIVIEEPKKTEPRTIVEEMPEFPGGDEGRLAFLKKHLIYPDIARTNYISGTVYVEFVVSETGTVENAKIKKGIGGGCDEEALRVVNLMTWTPGRQGGVAVPVRFTFPIRFVLREQ